ncbi:transposase family protein [Mycolicibacterium litorale]|uniref:Transposase family protein n=1 Tax=Candidatus Mycolicibacterium alkanivorans TaxID=2954114 RepID=A0ABS9YXK4_9MYCO|nr:transposase family protein [Candidatus Mycolicibacterium alkanivorans]MCI4675946.1 transposase family protein [Candidatus Mycolicibacterium alkanivorans]MCI4675956.1 transposase family protein [Candidatus Mycolicibacterium alkanivorans]
MDSITEALARWQSGERVRVLRTELLDVLAQVPDPRDARGVRYSLI